MPEEWLTYAEAADLLGCGESNIPKLVAKGRLRTHQQVHGHRLRRGTVARADVEQLAEKQRQATAELAAAAAEAERRRHPPDTVHEWIDIAEAARQLGRTEKAVLARIHRDRLPATRVGVRWWIRQDQLTLIEAGRLGTKTKRI